jgi:hypothetical protein
MRSLWIALVVGCTIGQPSAPRVRGTAAFIMRNNTSRVIDVHFADSIGANRTVVLPSTKVCWPSVPIPNVVTATAMWVLADTGGVQLLLTDSSAILSQLDYHPC